MLVKIGYLIEKWQTQYRKFLELVLGVGFCDKCWNFAYLRSRCFYFL